MTKRVTARIAAFCLATTVSLTALPTRAATLFLTCGEGSDQQNLTIDTDKSMVDGQSARITPTSIDWQTSNEFNSPKGRETVTHYGHIDRVSGTYTSRLSVEWPGGMNPGRETTTSCVAGSPPPTKF